MLGCIIACAPVAAADRAAGRDAEIHVWLDRWAAAFRDHDLDAIMAMYAPDVVSYDIVPPLQLVGKAAYRASYEHFLAQYQGAIEVEFRDLRIIAGEDIAFATMLQHISGTQKGGQRSTIWTRVTAGYRKINGAWLDVHDHVSVPSDFETGRAQLDLVP